MRLLITASVAIVLGSATITPAYTLEGATPVPNAKTAQEHSKRYLPDIAPLFLALKILPPEKSQQESAEEKHSGDYQPSAAWWMVGLTGVIAFIALLQTAVFSFQAFQLRKTIGKMDEIANREMRAYITVVVSKAYPQDRAKGIKFQGEPRMVNSGRTPAQKVNFKMRSAILPYPLPSNFQFPPWLRETLSERSELTAGPQQSVVLSKGGIVDDFVPDQDVEDIKHVAGGRALYTWGFITYEDIFGNSHSTEFCQSFEWLPDGKVWGDYTPGHNKGD
jgi:hypothetical protein